MNLLRKIITPYLCDYGKVLAYMWQQSDYRVSRFLRWWLSTNDYRNVAVRGQLVPTTAGKLVRCITTAIWLVVVSLAIASVILVAGITYKMAVGLLWAFVLPFLAALVSVGPIAALYNLVFLPKERARIARAKRIFHKHKGVRIAVAGSYGKTSMKELLALVLASEKTVAYTEGNKNTLGSQARFANSLTGDEDFVIVEFGEAERGDIAKMTQLVDPEFAFITGLAPNHLDQYKSIDDIVDDLTVLAKHCGKEKTFINTDNELLEKKLSDISTQYGKDGWGTWSVLDEKIAVNSLSFTLVKGKQKLLLTSGLVGRHNIAALAAVSGFAMDRGITPIGVETAIELSRPYEHRMEPRLFHGAWLIDDTYNGNLEGVRAGLGLLKELETSGRKIYVTPGLVDQGNETERAHIEIGRLIAQSNPDKLYVMKNSVSGLIRQSAELNGYKGSITEVEQPLQFYQNLEAIVAKGDIIMCQNDWPDIYK